MCKSKAMLLALAAAGTCLLSGCAEIGFTAPEKWARADLEPRVTVNQPPVAKLGADQLLASYDAGVSPYDGKRIEVSGAVKEVGENGAQVPYVLLASTTYPGATAVVCTFRADQRDLVRQFRKGQAVSFTGRCVGKPFGSVAPFGGAVSVDECAPAAAAAPGA